MASWCVAGGCFWLDARTPKKIAPGKWHLPGGHVEFGESPPETVVREFHEEFGLDIVVKSIINVFSYIHDDVHTIGISYAISCADIPDEIHYDPNDNEMIEFVDLRHLSDYLDESDHNFVTLQRFMLK